MHYFRPPLSFIFIGFMNHEAGTKKGAEKRKKARKAREEIGFNPFKNNQVERQSSRLQRFAFSRTFFLLSSSSLDSFLFLFAETASAPEGVREAKIRGFIVSK
jgi:hypothetical protein